MSATLKERIAQVVVQAGDDDGCSSIPSELIAAAAKLAMQLTPEDLSRFPEWWYPPLSAKSAGALKWKEGWERLWFEALVEILYQSGESGLPVLFEFLDRDLKTYHGMVVVRLLRFAANGTRKKEILDRLKTRLPALNHPAGTESVDEVMLWASYGDSRLTKLLRSMSKLSLKGIGQVTVGSAMKEWVESRSP
ncbi:hypothetical protein [Schlesneria sp. T3-172]|uniref:hypothetical protein n=1 Tax=Schlesneria TaxID=656899 RepID=UPI002EED917A